MYNKKASVPLELGYAEQFSPSNYKEKQLSTKQQSDKEKGTKQS